MKIRLSEMLYGEQPVDEAAKRPGDIQSDYLLIQHRDSGRTSLILLKRAEAEADIAQWSSYDATTHRISRQTLAGYIVYSDIRRGVCRVEAVFSPTPGFGPLMYELAMAELQHRLGDHAWFGSDNKVEEKARGIWDKFLAGANSDIENQWAGNISKQALMSSFRAAGFGTSSIPNQLLNNPTAPLPREQFMKDPELAALYNKANHPGLFYVYKLKAGSKTLSLLPGLLADSRAWAIQQFGDPPTEAMETLDKLATIMFLSVYNRS